MSCYIGLMDEVPAYGVEIFAEFIFFLIELDRVNSHLAANQDTASVA